MSGIEDLLADASSADDDDARRRAWEALVAFVRGYVAHRMGPIERRDADVTEVGDSIVGDFHRALADGKLRFETEAELHAYLRKMVSTKFADLGRKRMAERRGGGRAEAPVGPESELGEVEPGTDASVASPLRARELAERIEARLGGEARLLFELRARGAEWKEVAEALGIGIAVARQRAHRLREELRTVLKDDFSEFGPNE